MIMKMSTGNPNARSYSRHVNSGNKIANNKTTWKTANFNTSNKSQSIDQLLPTQNNQSLNTPKNINNVVVNQHDAKGFRILTYVFAHNINYFYGKTQKSILGEIQELYKIPLSVEEKGMLEQNLGQIFSKNIDKFMRDMLLRNTTILKSRQSYQSVHPRRNQYERSPDQYQEPQKNSPEKQENKKQQKKQKRPSTSVIRTNNHLNVCGVQTEGEDAIGAHKQMKGMENFDKKKHSFLPSSIKLETQEYLWISENNKRSKYQNKKYIHLFLSSGKTNPQDKSIFQQKNKKMSLNTQNLASSKELENEDYWRIDNKSARNLGHLDYESANQEIQNKTHDGQRAFRNWYSTKNHRKSIDYEKNNIREKLMIMNNAGSSSIIQTNSQGYKPKSKCWGINFVKAANVSGVNNFVMPSDHERNGHNNIGSMRKSQRNTFK